MQPNQKRADPGIIEQTQKNLRTYYLYFHKKNYVQMNIENIFKILINGAAVELEIFLEKPPIITLSVILIYFFIKKIMS